MPNITEIFTPSLEKPFFISRNMKTITRASRYDIYSISTLPMLIKCLQEQESPEIAIRYLLDTSGHLWFAEEGAAYGRIPAHYQMTGELGTSARCLTAGNLFFSKDYKLITKMNHKSGDFRPSFDSMKWALGILIAHQALLETFDIRFDLQFGIEELSSSGGLIRHHDVKLSDLIPGINALFDKKMSEKFLTQPESKIETIYEPIVKRFFVAAAPSSRGRLQLKHPLFDEDSDNPDAEVKRSAAKKPTPSLAPSLLGPN